MYIICCVFILARKGQSESAVRKEGAGVSNGLMCAVHGYTGWHWSLRKVCHLKS